MRKSPKELLRAVFKFLAIVITMSLLYQILELVIMVSVTRFFPPKLFSNEDIWPPQVLFEGVYVFSIFLVCFVMGSMLPMDTSIVRAAALFYVICGFVSEMYMRICAQIYVSTIRGDSVGYIGFEDKIVKYVIIILLTYLLSKPLHHWGKALVRKENRAWQKLESQVN